jgi:hypothetical protein
MATILVSTRNDRYTELRRVAWWGIGSSRHSRRKETRHNHRFGWSAKDRPKVTVNHCG